MIRARSTWYGRCLAAIGTSCLALACAACRHTDGASAQHDPNGPFSYDHLPHDTSGPTIDQPPPPGYAGSEYGDPARWTPPPAGPRPASGEGPSFPVGENPGWGYGGNVAGGGTPSIGNYPSDRP